MKPIRFALAVLLVISSMTFGCSDDRQKSEQAQQKEPPAADITLRVVAGSEAKHIAHIITACARKHGFAVEMHYSGSVDMMLAMKQSEFGFDAVLPASSIWLRLGDQQLRRVKEEASIMRSPVGLGIKKSIARNLGWVGKDVSIRDILAAVSSDKFRFAMTSATQSNSGFSSYIGMLIALSGNPDVLTADHLDQPQLQKDIRSLLSGVNRGSGSSGWLMDTFVKDYERLDAMFNYESMIITANQKLVASGKEPLYIVYPVDGLAVADSTLGFVDRPDRPDNADKKAAFIKLRDCLLSDAVQKQILQTGFRAGFIGMNPENAPKSVYNPDWGIDLARTISPIVWPDADVTYQAMTLYQTVFRKPSFTVFAVDCSGSMKGTGLMDLKSALSALFDPTHASKYLIQTGAQDVTAIVPFDDGFLWQRPLLVTGNEAADLQRLVSAINGLETRGKTNIYNPVLMAWQIFESVGDKIDNYLPSVILMTDGRSNEGSLTALESRWEGTRYGFDLPPVFCIMYGQADDSQLKDLAHVTYGKVFDGRHGGLQKAFRKAKGYN